MADQGQLLNGADYLAGVANFFENEAEDVPFRNYLAFGDLADQTWNDQPYEDAAPKISVKWSSDAGSSVQFTKTFTGSEQAGSYKDALTITGKPAGYALATQVSNVWSTAGYTTSTAIKKSFTGGTASKDDDDTYSWTSSEKNSYAKGTFSVASSFSFANADYAYKKTESTASTYQWDDESQTVTSEKGTRTITYSFTDTDKKLSFNSALKLVFDSATSDYNVSHSLHKIVTPDFSVNTLKFNFTTDSDGLAALPPIDADTSGNDFSVISGSIEGMVDPEDLEKSLWAFDNVVVISNADGAEVNLGAGNDKATGGIGDDTLIAGAGKDTLTGGKGSDTFSLNAEDYDFTSARTLLVDTITDFKYLPGREEDTLALEGFGDIGVYATIADAKKAEASENVIYESKTGKLWYDEDADGALVGALNFAVIKGIPLSYWDSL